MDDATVEIENVHRNMGIRGKTLVRAILDGAQQIALPAFVSTLCICIVFVPVLMLSGAAKSVHATGNGRSLRNDDVLPVDANYCADAGPLSSAAGDGVVSGGGGRPGRPSGGIIWHIHELFERRFESFATHTASADMGAGTPARKWRSIRRIYLLSLD